MGNVDIVRVTNAEKAVLGCALAGDTGRAVLLQLGDEDFFDPKCQLVAAVMRDMTRRGVPPDLITVPAEIAARGKSHLVKATDLHDLIQFAPPSMAAPFYAQQVRENARVRLAHAAGQRLAQMTNDDESADQLGEALARHADEMAAIPAPFDVESVHARTVHDLLNEDDEEEHWMIPGLIERGERIVITGPEGLGKRLRVDEPIPTPAGWTTMGELVVGDAVIDRHGKPCRVTAVSEVEQYPDAWAVVFDDGTVIEADAKHQWITMDYAARQKDHAPGVRTTEQIRRTLMARDGAVTNHAIPVAGPLDLPQADLPVPPYTLGAWLGDGSTAAAQMTLNRRDADEIQTHITAEGVGCHRTPSGEREGSICLSLEGGTVMLRNAGVLGFKSIPDPYLRASLAQRQALLAGLMDTDGTVGTGADGFGRGKGAALCTITLTCKPLIPGVVELIRSLGIKVSVSESDAKLDGRVVGRKWVMTFQSPFNPFRTSRKGDRWDPLRTRRSQYRYVVDVRRVEPTPMRCITVDSPDHSYLAGRRMVPTHNSTIIKQLSACVAAGVDPWSQERVAREGFRVLHIDTENSRRQTRRNYRWIGVGVPRNSAPEWQSRITLHIRTEGVNLAGRDRAWFHQVAAACSPDLIVLGPAYKLMTGLDPNKDADVLSLLAAIDEVRTRHDAAVLIEAHSPHGGEIGKRPVRPFGSSVWLRWPEVGFGFRVDEDQENNNRELERAQGVRRPGNGSARPEYLRLVSWRGQREDRTWPGGITWGPAGGLPWVRYQDPERGVA